MLFFSLPLTFLSLSLDGSVSGDGGGSFHVASDSNVKSSLTNSLVHTYFFSLFLDIFLVVSFLPLCSLRFFL